MQVVVMCGDSFEYDFKEANVTLDTRRKKRHAAVPDTRPHVPPLSSNREPAVFGGGDVIQ